MQIFIKPEELDNVAQTFYYLMRGVYNLDIFKSPYNDKVANELTSEDGKAFHTFFPVYEAIEYLSDLLNFLNLTQQQDFEILDVILSDADDVLHTVAVCSVKLAFGKAGGYTGPRQSPPLYDGFWEKELRRPGGTGSVAYARLLEDVTAIKDMLNEFVFDSSQAFRVLDTFLALLKQRFSVFADIAFSYGLRLASGELPVWINPEFHTSRSRFAPDIRLS